MAKVKLNATAGAEQGWFDKPIGTEILALAKSKRNAAALAKSAEAINGMGPGCNNTLANALSKDSPTIRDYIKFMDKPDAGTKLAAAAQTVKAGGNVVGIMFAAYGSYKNGLDS